MNEFIEVQFLGAKKMEFRMKAEQYPEKLKIMDMLAKEDPYLELDETNKRIFSAV